MQPVRQILCEKVKELFGLEVEIVLDRPDDKFGDYSSNVALQLAGRLNQPPRDLAQQLADSLSQTGRFKKVEVAGPGFVNFWLEDKDIIASLGTEVEKDLTHKQILVEFGDPNPFKEMHIGHLYSYIAGDSICRLLEAKGAEVVRLSYHGDVGLHVAKAIWGMKNLPSGKELGEYYASGARAYEESDSAKSEIEDINQSIYQGDNQEITRLYNDGRQRSFEDFDNTLKKLGVRTDKRYLESQTAEVGLKFVRENTGKVFKESEGAVVYKGEKVGLHTRVFINSKGLPTYETKDLGLAEIKNGDFPEVSRSIIMTANEQSEYFKVMLAALAEIDKQLADKTTHITHGFVSLSTGKMSSRTGDVFTADRLITDVSGATTALYPKSREETVMAAIKYGFLKHRLGSDITYDIEESVSIEGNSGPYLQYAHARACSILAKARKSEATIDMLDDNERLLARKISQYTEVVDQAVRELKPHYLATYLYEMTQRFNSFYENNRVIGDKREKTRLALIKAYGTTLKEGLGLLGIAAPEKV